MPPIIKAPGAKARTVSETVGLIDIFPNPQRKRTSAVKGEYKLIRPGHSRGQLYRFKDDPMEQENLIGDY